MVNHVAQQNAFTQSSKPAATVVSLVSVATSPPSVVSTVEVASSSPPSVGSTGASSWTISAASSFFSSSSACTSSLSKVSSAAGSPPSSLPAGTADATIVTMPRFWVWVKQVGHQLRFDHCLSVPTLLRQPYTLLTLAWTNALTARFWRWLKHRGYCGVCATALEILNVTSALIVSVCRWYQYT